MTVKLYPNVPEEVVPEELPEELTVMRNKHKGHIAHTNLVNEYEDETPKHAAICLCSRTVRGKRHSPIFMTNICKDCLGRLNEEMENAMWDQKAETYYLPTNE